MIVFDLRCGTGHVFEAWFGSSDDYESQKLRGLVSCPICGDAKIEKAVMAPNVAPKGNSSGRALAKVDRADAPLPVAGGVATADGPSPTQVKAMLQTLARAQSEMLSRSEHVGRRFADEARAIHLGETDARLIHGQATPDEARSLIEDGIEVSALPFPVLPPEAEN